MVLQKSLYHYNQFISYEHNVKINYSSKVPGKQVYYSSAASSKRLYTLYFLYRLYGLETEFSYIDGLCSSGVMGLLVQKNFPLAKVTYNDAIVHSEYIVHNIKSNGLKEYDVLNQSITDIYKQYSVLDLDPYGSPLKFKKAIININPLYLISTHTDLLNLFSRRQAPSYFRQRGIKFIHSSMNYELGVRALLYLYYLELNKAYELVDLYKHDKYITLYLKPCVTNLVQFIEMYGCSCGYVNKKNSNCILCRTPTTRIGPLYYTPYDKVLGEIGGYNKEKYILLKDTALMNLGFYRSRLDNILKSVDDIDTAISRVYKQYPRKDQ